MIDPVPYRNEEIDQRFTQEFYQAQLIRLYQGFEHQTRRKSRLRAILDSTMFNVRLGLLHAQAVSHGLEIRTDIKFDEKLGYCFDKLPALNIRKRGRDKPLLNSLQKTEYE